MQIAVVFNPSSGVRQATAAFQRVTIALSRQGHHLTIIRASSAEAASRELAQRRGELDAVIAIGGDGTLNSVVNALLSEAHAETPVAFVPTGRGRDTARTLSCWSVDEIESGFDLLHVVPVDVGRVTMTDASVRYFVNVCNLGLASHAANVANKLPRQVGTASYVLGAVSGFLETKGEDIECLLDGDRIIQQDRVLCLSICNGRSFGGGLHIAPAADATDGRLDIVTIRNANLLDLVRQMRRLRSGEAFDHRALSRWQAEFVTIIAAGFVTADIDGEILPTLPVRAQVLSRALPWIPRP